MGAVVFRRIHGHIVPIRQRASEGADANRNRAKGAALVGAGGATAYAAGKISAAIMEDAAHADNAAHDARRARKQVLEVSKKHGPLFEHGGAKEAGRLKRIASKSAAQANKLGKSAFRIRTAGTVAAASLIAGGVHTALSKGDKQESKKTNAAVAVGSGTAAGFAIHYGYGRRMGNRGFDALKRAAKRAITKV